MNGLDVAIVAVAVLGAGYGLMRGALGMVTAILSLLAAIYLASIYYPVAAALAHKQLGLGDTAAALLGYAVVFFAVFILIEVAGSSLSRLLRRVHLGWIDRLAGGVAGGAIALALMGLILMLLTILLPQGAPLLKNSELAPQVLSYSSSLLHFIPPELTEAYNRKRDELTRYWLNQALPRLPVPTPNPTS